MANFSTNQFKAGLKLMIDGEPCNILENELVKPGKGQAFSRVKIRKLISNKVLEKTFKSGESCEGADVMETELAYLYADGEFWHFMNNETFEQIAADEKAVADCLKWLKEGDICTITLWNGLSTLTSTSSAARPASSSPPLPAWPHLQQEQEQQPGPTSLYLHGCSCL